MPESPSSSAQAARERVARQLRALREAAGLPGHRLADRCGWHKSKVSRIENAKTRPSDDDIRAWCAACGAGREASDLIAASRAADSMYFRWQQAHREGMRRVQDEALQQYTEARLCRIYSSTVMPGVVQTRAYATALMTAITRFQGTPDDVADAVEARVARGSLLHGGRQRFSIVLEEAVVRYRLGDGATMGGQLGRLLEVMTLPSVSVGIIPFAAERHMWPLEAFYLFDDEYVEEELLSAGVKITAPSEVAEFDRAFKILSGMAVHGASARALIASALAALP